MNKYNIDDVELYIHHTENNVFYFDILSNNIIIFEGLIHIHDIISILNLLYQIRYNPVEDMNQEYMLMPYQTHYVQGGINIYLNNIVISYIDTPFTNQLIHIKYDYTYLDSRLEILYDKIINKIS